MALTSTLSNPTWGKEFLRSVADVVANGINRVQVAQMTSILGKMSDQDLQAIGVQRSEIAQHAEKLVNGSANLN